MSNSFHTVDSALRFAFSITEYPIISSAKLAPSKARRDSSMTAHDWHAQGALIRGYIGRLNKDSVAYIYAFYGRGAEREQAMAHLLTLSQIRLAGRRDVSAAVLRRYTANGNDKRTLRQIASDLGVHNTTVMRTEVKLKEAITRLFARTDAEVAEHFRVTGLVS